MRENAVGFGHVDFLLLKTEQCHSKCGDSDARNRRKVAVRRREWGRVLQRESPPKRGFKSSVPVKGWQNQGCLTYQPLVCSMCASSSALTARPFIAACRSSLTSSNTLGS